MYRPDTYKHWGLKVVVMLVGTRGKGTTGSLIGFWGVDEWLRKRGKTCSILLLLDIEDFGIPSNVTSTSSCTQNRRSLYMCSSRLSSFAYRPLCPIIYITVSPLFLRSPPPPPRNYSKVDIDNRVASSHRRIAPHIALLRTSARARSATKALL
jgi:hypothetical protein